MKKMYLKRVFIFLLTFVMVIPLVACGKNNISQIEDDNTQTQTEVIFCLTYNPEDAEVATMDFYVRLFQNSVNVTDKEGNTGNVLISPFSVLSVLAMISNGAEGETLVQLEENYGIQHEALNEYLKKYSDSLESGENYKLNVANSIWMKQEDDTEVKEAFLDSNKVYFGAEAFEAPFDKTTVEKINGWVLEHTDGLITEMLSDIPKDAVMYLINAIVFDAKWEEPYESMDVRESKFTLENGLIQDVELMYSEENLYLEDEMATGVIKYYADKKYAFVALLPNEGVTVSEYVESLSGEHLNELLSNPTEVTVKTYIPKFEVEYGVLMNQTLESMGMADLFDSRKADLSGIGTSEKGNIYISRVIHKSYIKVDEEGTRAAAATIAEAKRESAMEMPESKTVRLDRPFVYMIIDCENDQPLFMGTLNQIYPLIWSLSK